MPLHLQAGEQGRLVAPVNCLLLERLPETPSEEALRLRCVPASQHQGHELLR